MMQILLGCCLWLMMALHSHTTQAQNLQWALQIGGPGSDSAFPIVKDNDNNIFIAGAFAGGVDFDPGEGEEWVSAGNGSDAFILKLDPAGNFIWVRNFGGANSINVRDLVIDDEGNLYSTGSLRGTADFDPGPGTYNLSSKGDVDFFIQKLDAHGNFNWAIALGDTEDDFSFSIQLNDEGQLYIGGYFDGTIDFDPGPGVMELSSIASNAFIYKITREGQLVWATVLRNGFSCEARALVLDPNDNVVITGGFFGTVDVDPGPGELKLKDTGGGDSFVAKYDPDGIFIWGKSFSGPHSITGYAITSDEQGNVLIAGSFQDTVDFDPGINEFKLISKGNSDQFVCKLDPQGEFLWAKGIGGSQFDIADAVSVDRIGNVYLMSRFTGTMDADPGSGVTTFTSHGETDMAFTRFNSNGDFIWAFPAGGDEPDVPHDALINDDGSIYYVGDFTGTTDFDPSETGSSFVSYGHDDIFLARYVQKGVQGFLFNDTDLDCTWDQTELGISNRYGIIQPGNQVVKTNRDGKWYVDSIPAGQYTIRFDTSGYWWPTCELIKTFEVTDPNFMTLAPSMSLTTSQLCAKSEVSIQMLTNRPCENFERIFVKACNAEYATGILKDAYVDIELDTFLTPTAFSIAFEELGNNVYRVFLDDLLPGDCIDFTIDARLSCEAVTGMNLCARACMFPADTCMFEEVYTFNSPDPPACELTYDHSDVEAEGWCNNDSLFFRVTNVGTGSMQCSTAVKFFIDGIVILIDSVKLNEGENHLFAFVGDGRTWHMELDQHPLQRGRSMPGVTLERCGNASNWTPGLFSIFEDDDADPVKDEFCSPVRNSFDPNDKTASPSGVGTSHRILPNGEMDFIIRFQNTGNDTAYKVVIRDTLDLNFDVFTVQPGSSSHDGYFTISGPSALEWVFNNILLPDSTTDLVRSNGFVSFSVRQKPDLPDGTNLENTAAIYFDHNQPVSTNTTRHVVDRNIQEPAWSVTKEQTFQSCFPFSLNNIEYNRTGQYYQFLDASAAPDTLLILSATILTEVGFSDVTVEEDKLISSALLASYQWYDCLNEAIIPGETSRSFSPASNGVYAVIVSENGCTDTSACVTFQFVATEEIPNRSYRIYPNPSSGEFTLEPSANVTKGELHVFDIVGRPVLVQKISGNHPHYFSIENSPGLYFVQLKIDGKIEWIRIEKSEF